MAAAPWGGFWLVLSVWVCGEVSSSSMSSLQPAPASMDKRMQVAATACRSVMTQLPAALPRADLGRTRREPRPALQRVADLQHAAAGIVRDVDRVVGALADIHRANAPGALAELAGGVFLADQDVEPGDRAARELRARDHAARGRIAVPGAVRADDQVALHRQRAAGVANDAQWSPVRRHDVRGGSHAGRIAAEGIGLLHRRSQGLIGPLRSLAQPARSQ